MSWSTSMSLQQSRVLFTSYLVALLQFIQQNCPDYEVALDEGQVLSPRPVWLDPHTRATRLDARHMMNSFHYRGLAVDLLLYKADGTYVQDGSDPIFQKLDAFARTLDPWFGLGIHFHDANHVSLGESKP